LIAPVDGQFAQQVRKRLVVNANLKLIQFL
jgi:hypothetical protein